MILNKHRCNSTSHRGRSSTWLFAQACAAYQLSSGFTSLDVPRVRSSTRGRGVQMRIGLVSQWYSPEPGFIPSNLAAELASRGHEVRVLTGYPNYPEGRI